MGLTTQVKAATPTAYTSQGLPPMVVVAPDPRATAHTKKHHSECHSAEYQGLPIDPVSAVHTQCQR